jgi:succinoglycan biosynthesis protein ExoL
MRAFHLSDVRAKLVFVPVIASPLVIMFLEPNSIWRAPTSYVLWWMLVSMLAKVAGRGKSTEEGPRLDYGTPTQLGQTEPLDSTGSEISRGRIKVLSALQLFGHPRDSKRIAMLKKAGFEVEAVAFEREKHDVRLPDCPVERLAKIQHGRYIQRILPQIAALPAIRRAIRRNHIVYASGPDMALSALIAGFGLRRPVVLEVGDIRGPQTSRGITGFVTRMVERFTVNACKLLVVTASGFVDEYYRKWVKTQTPAMIMENKQEEPEAGSTAIEPVASPAGSPLVDRPLRIGYFGVLRCEWSWRVLEALALARPDGVEIVAAGYVLNSLDIPKRAEEFRNVEFLGEFRSPDDLPKLYSSVDMVWGCYPYPGPDDQNWRWARTNRFYESCLYQKPIIALRDSGDAGEVERHDLGPIVNGPSIEGVVDALSKITPSDLARWQENLAKLPRDVYVYTTEGDELADALKELVDMDRIKL